MRCVIVTPHRYGIHEMTHRVGDIWESGGHDVEYVLAEGNAARVGPVTIGAPAISVWWYRTLAGIANRDRLPDLIWTHQPVTPVLPTKDSEFWNRMILTVHSTHMREYQLTQTGVYPTRLRPYYWFVSRLEQRFHTAVQNLDSAGPTYTVVSPHLQDELNALGVSRSVHVPNGVFTPDIKSLTPIRDEYGIPEDATVVFNIGSLTTQKRPGVFANLLSKAVTTLDDTYCIMAGTGAYESKIRKYESERFKLVGYVSEETKWRWFADADVFASLSAYEGMPVASAEALSFGLPLLLSDIPAHRHLLSEYDAAGELVNDEVTSITAAISELTGTRTEADLPSWDEVASTYIDLQTERSRLSQFNPE